MKTYHGKFARVDATACMRVIKGLGWLLIVWGLMGVIDVHQSHLRLWGNIVVWVIGALSITLTIISTRMERATSPYPSLLLELVGLLARSSCAVAGTLCAVAGLWPLTCFFWGMGLITVPGRAQGYMLLVPLADNGDKGTNSAHPIWAHFLINGDGIDICPYKDRPGSLDEDPMSRILVEYHRNQLRVLAWPEGISIDEDPEVVEALVSDVAGFKPPLPADGTSLERTSSAGS
jgi:hypothetical protein